MLQTDLRLCACE